MLTKSKTKLLTVDRKFSVKRSVVEKAVREVYEAMGFEVPENSKLAKPSKAKK